MLSPLHHALGVVSLLAGAALLPASTPLVAPPSPPSIEELVGSWQMDFAYTGLDLGSDTKIKTKESGLYAVTLPGSGVVRLENSTTLEVIQGRYTDGYLLIGRSSTTPVDGDPVPDSSSTSIIEISGKPGKLKGKGEALEFDLPGDDLGKLKIKMKQIGPR
ncbi:MAG: hypothetical protein JNM84_16125 [Planctomycetes bacterium]|nr:hypothetical protein [Planctomycetota bacterium]